MKGRPSMHIDNLLYSVIGGLVVLVVVWFWNNVLPRILQQFYHHEPSVEGKWRTTFREDGTEYHETVTLTQKGRRVRGEIALNDATDETTMYKFEGTFKHLILTGTYCSTDPTDYEQGAFALRYTRQGLFKGQHALISKQSEQLISSDYEWTRV
jgi:hypothetical protein